MIVTHRPTRPQYDQVIKIRITLSHGRYHWQRHYANPGRLATNSDAHYGRLAEAVAAARSIYPDLPIVVAEDAQLEDAYAALKAHGAHAYLGQAELEAMDAAPIGQAESLQPWAF